MNSPIDPDAIAARGYPRFLVSFVALGAVCSVLLVGAALSSRGSVKPGIVLLLLTPVVLVWRARRVGAATSFVSFFARAVLTYAIAPIVPALLMAIAGSGDPGASAHGGLFLAVIILVPYSLVVGGVLGVFAGLLSYGVMRIAAPRA